MKKIVTNNENLLDLIPQRQMASEENDKGLIIILKPKIKNKFLAKYLLSRMKDPNYKIKLDDYGSFVWKNCDGENTVMVLGELLIENFGEKIEPVYERLGMFIRTLESNQFISYLHG